MFNLRARQRRPGANRDATLWAMSRPTAWRLIKRVMARANIQGRQATGKGLRHGFGVAMVTARRPLPIHVLSQLMGHERRFIEIDQARIVAFERLPGFI